MVQGNIADNGGFIYEDKRYDIVVQLGVDSFREDEVEFNLIASKILELNIVNNLESYVLRGFIRYIDEKGEIAQLFGMQRLYCNIQITATKQERNGNVVQETPEVAFYHEFIVDNITPKDRQQGGQGGQEFLILLVGSEQESLYKTPQYIPDANSDNDNGALDLIELGEKDITENPYYIIQKIFQIDEVGLEVDDKSFKKYGHASPIKFVASPKQNVLQMLSYLLSKTCYKEVSGDDDSPEVIAFLTYDGTSGKYFLRTFEYDIEEKDDDENCRRVYAIQLNFGDQIDECLSHKNKAKISAYSTQGWSDILKNAAEIHVKQYDQASNSFTTKIYKCNTICKSLTSNSENAKISDSSENKHIIRTISSWDSNLDMYKTILQMIVGWDSLLLNVGGMDDRRLMDIVNLTIDDQNRIEQSSLDSKYEALQVRAKHRQFIGNWFITSLVTVIRPADAQISQTVRLTRPDNTPTVT